MAYMLTQQELREVLDVYEAGYRMGAGPDDSTCPYEKDSCKGVAWTHGYKKGFENQGYLPLKKDFDNHR